jgi:glycosyltransferase involved in cell wall biosynthesis
MAAKLAGPFPVAWGIHHTHLDPRKDKLTTIVTARAGAPLARWCADRILYCAESARAVHERLGYPRAKGRVISNGFDMDVFVPDAGHRLSLRAELGLAPEVLLVGLVARFSPYKDHANFVRAAARVAATHPEVRFVLCGDGIAPDNAELALMLREAGLLGRAHLLGRRADMPRIHAALDIAVSSSSTEALPLAVGESMAAAVPCVVTDVGDSARLVGESGIAVEPRSSEALAAGIERLLRLAPEERRLLGEAARARVGARFAFAAMVAAYEGEYLALAPVA